MMSDAARRLIRRCHSICGAKDKGWDKLCDLLVKMDCWPPTAQRERARRIRLGRERSVHPSSGNRFHVNSLMPRQSISRLIIRKHGFRFRTGMRMDNSLCGCDRNCHRETSFVLAATVDASYHSRHGARLGAGFSKAAGRPYLRANRLMGISAGFPFRADHHGVEFRQA